MAFHKGPKIVTDNLVLMLDAANPKSYPGSGTVWGDLSGNSNNGSLTNSPTYDSVEGAFEFSASSNNTVLVSGVPVNTTSTEGNTVEQWFKWTGEPNVMPFTWGDVSWDLYFGPGGLGINNGLSLVYGVNDDDLVDVWAHVSTYYPNGWSGSKDSAKIYINGTLKTLSVRNGTFQDRALSSSQPICISGGYAGETGNYAFGGKIATTSIYSRELSDNEVLQNFNATRSRFGL